MASRQYGYQYETSPRKIKPDYSKPKRNTNQYNKPKTKVKTKPKTTKKQNDVKKQIKKQEEIKKQIQKQEDLKAKNALIAKTKTAIFFKTMLIFVIMFFMIFMNSRISESFTKIQKLKAEITELQKENDQLEINIQNSINLNTIEQLAKELLGMQKLSNKQINYITLSKKDYVEPRTEKVIIEEEQTWLENILDKIQKMF